MWTYVSLDGILFPIHVICLLIKGFSVTPTRTITEGSNAISPVPGLLVQGLIRARCYVPTIAGIACSLCTALSFRVNILHHPFLGKCLPNICSSRPHLTYSSVINSRIWRRSNASPECRSVYQAVNTWPSWLVAEIPPNSNARKCAEAAPRAAA